MSSGVDVGICGGESLGSGGSGILEDTTAPILTGAVAIDDGTRITSYCYTNEAGGRAYMVIVPNGDEPTTEQVKLGHQSDGTNALISANIRVHTVGPVIFDESTALAENTIYDLWMVHTDAAGNDSNKIPSTATITTQQAVLTNLSAGTIGTNTITPQCDCTFDNGILFYGVSPTGLAVPTGSQVKAGTGSIIFWSGQWNRITATGTFIFPQETRLTTGTTYDLHFAHQSNTGITSATLTIPFTTL